MTVLVRRYLVANAIKCQPVLRVIFLGIKLKTGTNTWLKTVAFRPFCNLDFTGNRSGTNRRLANGFSKMLIDPLIINNEEVTRNILTEIIGSTISNRNKLSTNGKYA